MTMTDEQITEIIIHPRVKAAVERMVHAKMVELGLALTGYQMAVQKAEKEKPPEGRKSARQRAEDEGLVLLSEAQRLLGVTASQLAKLRAGGHLRVRANRYVSQEAIDHLREQLATGHVELPNTRQRKRKANGQREVPSYPTLPSHLTTIATCASLMNVTPARVSQLLIQHGIPTEKMRLPGAKQALKVFELRAMERATGRKIGRG